MLSYDEFEDARIKHLEMIQAVIARLAGNGFFVKAWTITVAGAFFGLALNADQRLLAIASVVPTLAFWMLDTHFLRSERLFRELHRRVAERDGTVQPFFMAATDTGFISESPTRVKSYWRTALLRPVMSAFYGGILIVAVLVALLAVSDNSADQGLPDSVVDDEAQ